MMSFTVPLILAIATLAPLATVAQNNSTGDKAGTLPPIFYAQFVLANSLKLGDSCSRGDESYRQSAFSQMKRYPKDSKLYDQAFDSIVSSTVQNNRTFCSAMDMLVCDGEKEECVCGESAVQVSSDFFPFKEHALKKMPQFSILNASILLVLLTYQGGHGVKYGPSTYESEFDAYTGKNVCRWSRGAPCNPEVTESAIKKQASFVPKCAQGLNCTYLQDGTACTEATFFKFALDTIRNGGTREDYVEGVMTGKMCQCASENNAVTSNNGRFM